MNKRQIELLRLMTAAADENNSDEPSYSLAFNRLDGLCNAEDIHIKWHRRGRVGYTGHYSVSDKELAKLQDV